MVVIQSYLGNNYKKNSLYLFSTEAIIISLIIVTLHLISSIGSWKVYLNLVISHPTPLLFKCVLAL